MRNNLHNFSWLLLALIAVPLLSLLLIAMTAINILRLTVSVPRTFIKVVREANQEFRNDWLKALEPHQVSWLERHQKVESFVDQVNFYLKTNYRLADIAERSFEDVTRYKK